MPLSERIHFVKIKGGAIVKTRNQCAEKKLSTACMQRQINLFFSLKIKIYGALGETRSVSHIGHVGERLAFVKQLFGGIENGLTARLFVFTIKRPHPLATVGRAVQKRFAARLTQCF